MIRTQIQLHGEQIQWLKKYALEKGISMSQAIRDSIDSYRANMQRIRELNAKKQKALKAVGSFSADNERRAHKNLSLTEHTPVPSSGATRQAETTEGSDVLLFRHPAGKEQK